MEANQSIEQTFIVASRLADPSGSGESAFNDPALISRAKPFLASDNLTTINSIPLLDGVLSGRLSGVALVDRGDLDSLIDGFLELLSQVSVLSPLLFVGRDGGVIFKASK